MGEQKHVIIIGSGVAGLATACRLQSDGFQVSVLEANDYPGGKLTEFNRNGYRFDAGPSLFTMPHYLDDVFIHAGKNPRDYYNHQQLNISCQYFYEDKTRLTAWADTKKFATEVEEKLQVPGDSMITYLRKSEHIYTTASHIFLENSLHKSSTWLTRSVAKSDSQQFQSWDCLKPCISGMHDY